MCRFVAVFILSVFLFGCSQDRLSGISGGPIKPLIMEGFTMTETENGKKRLVVVAENAEIDKNNKMIRANKINMKYYNEKESVTSTLTSERATLEIGTNDMEAEGNVVLITDIGAKLETEKLKLISATNKVVTDTPVRFTKGGNVLTGKGLEADSRLENALIKEVLTKVTNLKELGVTKKQKQKKK